MQQLGETYPASLKSNMRRKRLLDPFPTVREGHWKAACINLTNAPTSLPQQNILAVEQTKGVRVAASIHNQMISIIPALSSVSAPTQRKACEGIHKPRRKATLRKLHFRNAAPVTRQPRNGSPRSAKTLPHAPARTPLACWQGAPPAALALLG